ncbi:MAG: DUF371 domain-containing protein [Candidatus Helarchaeota archaeon]
MTLTEEIVAYGHPNILGTHKTTFEFTKKQNLTKRGDCIIGVAANKAISELSQKFKELARSNIKIRCILYVNNLKEEIWGFGNKSLSFLHPTDIVIRKSNYICSRTLMIKANKSAKELNRKIMESLKNPETIIQAKFMIDNEI